MKPATVTILEGDVLDRLRELPENSVHCVVTSPPYWGLRDYGVDGQIGLEPTLDEFIAKLVAVFAEVRRVLRPDGTLWLNMGDGYSSAGGKRDTEDKRGPKQCSNRGSCDTGSREVVGLKPKDLIGQPWRLAFALQADGWWLRSDIIWHKPAPMPESVTDRPTKSHEYVFLLTKSARYFYDAEAIKEQASENTHSKGNGDGVNPKSRTPAGWNTGPGGHSTLDGRYPAPRSKQNESFSAGITGIMVSTRNARTVWTITSEPFSGAHYATFPTELPKRCILAGTSARGCCAKCGAPWERETDSWIEHTQKTHTGAKYGGNGAFQNAAANRHRDGHLPGCKIATTTGWRATCNCDCQEVEPCTVLDPFAGTFTTCAAALDLGRSSIGIELNPESVLLGRERMAVVTPGLAL